MHPALRFAPGEIRETAVRLVAYVGALAMLSILAASLFETSPVPLVRAPVAQEEWVNVERPYPAFNLTLAELAEADMHYAIRRNAKGNGRKDIMTWGQAGAGNADVMDSRFMIEIY